MVLVVVGGFQSSAAIVLISRLIFEDVVGGLGAREGLYCRMVFFYSCFIGF